MKEISDLLQESERLRLETDDLGPQDEIEYWKSKAARLANIACRANDGDALQADISDIKSCQM